MATPTGTVTFDKTVYAPGDTITATVSYSDADSMTGTGEFILRDAAGNSKVLTGTFSIKDTVTVTPALANSRAWTPVAGSDTGSLIKFTALA